MKYILIICLGLLLSGARLSPVSIIKRGHYAIENKVPAALRSYWFRKTHKEVIRGNSYTHTIIKAIDNSFHFIKYASPFKQVIY